MLNTKPKVDIWLGFSPPKNGPYLTRPKNP